LIGDQGSSFHNLDLIPPDIATPIISTKAYPIPDHFDQNSTNQNNLDQVGKYEASTPIRFKGSPFVYYGGQQHISQTQQGSTSDS